MSCLSALYASPNSWPLCFAMDRNSLDNMRHGHYRERNMLVPTSTLGLAFDSSTQYGRPQDFLFLFLLVQDIKSFFLPGSDRGEYLTQHFFSFSTKVTFVVSLAGMRQERSASLNHGSVNISIFTGVRKERKRNVIHLCWGHCIAWIWHCMAHWSAHSVKLCCTLYLYSAGMLSRWELSMS